jgi:hypothetical protein
VYDGIIPLSHFVRLNHFLLHIACNVGNAALFVGLRLARSSA